MVQFDPASRVRSYSPQKENGTASNRTSDISDNDEEIDLVDDMEIDVIDGFQFLSFSTVEEMMREDEKHKLERAAFLKQSSNKHKPNHAHPNNHTYNKGNSTYENKENQANSNNLESSILDLMLDIRSVSNIRSKLPDTKTNEVGTANPDIPELEVELEMNDISDVGKLEQDDCPSDKQQIKATPMVNIPTDNVTNLFYQDNRDLQITRTYETDASITPTKYLGDGANLTTEAATTLVEKSAGKHSHRKGVMCMKCKISKTKIASIIRSPNNLQKGNTGFLGKQLGIDTNSGAVDMKPRLSHQFHPSQKSRRLYEQLLLDANGFMGKEFGTCKNELESTHQSKNRDGIRISNRLVSFHAKNEQNKLKFAESNNLKLRIGSHGSSKQKLQTIRYMEDWMPVIKGKQLIIEGDLMDEHGNRLGRFTSSKMLIRKTEYHFQSRNATYELRGKMTAHNLPKFVIDSFSQGLPYCWKVFTSHWRQFNKERMFKNGILKLTLQKRVEDISSDDDNISVLSCWKNEGLRKITSRM